MCNDFTNHCTSSSGVRSQFATYDATQSAGDVDRLYFVTQNGNEVVYLGFKGGGLTNPASPARHIVFRIKNLGGTIVLAEQNLPTAGTGFISTFAQAVNGPNQLPSPAITTGYDALVFSPPSPGTYYIEFSVKRDDNNNIYTGTFNLALFDITIGNTVTHVAKPGRLFSKSWQFYETTEFYSKNYIISDDSIVTSAQFTGMEGGHWNQYCNQTGCGNSSANWLVSRKSLYEEQALFPQYKIFLNAPDPLLFPSATTLGQVIPPLPYGVQNCATGHIVFHVTVNKPGNVEITLTFPTPYQPRVLNQAVVAGVNLFDWDGLDGTLLTGVNVPNNTNIQFTVKYINGLTNLPLYDVEGNENGFTIALVSPAGTTPAVFWDDTNIPSGTNNSSLPGCTSPPGCHTWTSVSGSGWGDLNTVNTWWYNVSTTTTPVTIVEFRSPQALVIQQQPPQVFCANTGGHVFSVTPEPNTDVYHWSYTPSTGVTISQATPGSPSVTVTFGPTAVSGSLQVYGSNGNCSMNGPTSSLAVTINPVPNPTLNGANSVCAGQTNVTYTAEPGKTNYQWTVSSGGIITGGGSSTSNTITVTWTTSGTQTVSVNYQNGTTLCTAPAPTILPVTVNPRPVPSLTGNTLVCIGSAGMVYTTNPGKSNYIWTVSPGGTITAGGTTSSSTVTVTWNTAGPQAVSVTFTDPLTLCTALVPTQLNVTVNTLPSPTFLAGSTSVCKGVPGNLYSTETGMSNYIWSVSGGFITSGGTSNDPSATITWTTTGTQSVSVNYTYPFSSCTAPVPTYLPVTVNPLPAPSFVSGPNSVCQLSSGNVYTTEPGMVAYQWSVTGGVITAGGGFFSNMATVMWTNVGQQSISVNYTDPTTNCMAATPTVYWVSVQSLPVPAFLSGENSVCLNTPGHHYATEPGKNNYIWTVTGGSITNGGGPADPSVTVTWNTPGVQSVSVGYTDPVTQCASGAPSVFNVSVQSLPIPTFISGVNSVCKGSSGNEYNTEPGMLNYTWSVAGGTITGGGTQVSNSATITWDVVGQQTVNVGYTDPVTQCASPMATPYEVTVKPLPVPVISGPGAACLNTPGPHYSTDAGMSDYTWTVPGATVTTGATPESIDVVWNSTGVHVMTVGYTAQNGCVPEALTEMSVMVNTLPTPSLQGLSVICTGIPVTYSTEPGMQNYIWLVSAGGEILSGGTPFDNTVVVSWNTPGQKQISVNYSLGTGCSAASPVSGHITVNQSTPPEIQESPTGLNCATFSNSYTTQAGMTGYSWSVSSGGTITSPTNGNSVNVQWNTAGPQWIEVNFANNHGCIAPTPTRFDLVVNPLPVSTITAAAGPDCESVAHGYYVPTDPACSYNWMITPSGRGTVTTGQGSSTVGITWQSSGSAQILVTATNTTTGCFTSSGFSTNVYPKPNPVFIPCFDLVTTPDAKKFNLRGASPFLAGQGVFSGSRVSLNGSTGQYQFDPTGATAGSYPVTYTYVNAYGCPASPPAVTITVQNSPFFCGGELFDVRDGHSYATSMIGGKCWMSENLSFGVSIGEYQPSTDNCIDEKYCLPADTGCISYGGLYQWEEMLRYGNESENKGICPPSWHIPTENEWQMLLIAIGTGNSPPDGISGSFLKDPYLPAGFNALLKGMRYLNRSWAYTDGMLTGAMFWTVTPNGSERAMARGVNLINPSTSRYAGSKGNAFSLRCVHD